MQIIYLFITRPFGLALMALYNLIGSYGVSILVFTLLTKILLLPLAIKTKKSMSAMTAVQPKIADIQKRYKGNQQKINEEMQKVYAEHNISPMGGCLPTLIQLPILIGLYGVIQKPLTFMMGINAATIKEIAEKIGVEMASNNVRAEIQLAGKLHENFDKVSSLAPNLVDIDFNFLGINLTATPNFKEIGILWLIPILSGITALLSSIITQKIQGNTGAVNSQMKTMLYIMPLMSVYFGFMLPACLGVYWIAGNILMIFQEILLTKVFKIGVTHKPATTEKK